MLQLVLAVWVTAGGKSWRAQPRPHDRCHRTISESLHISTDHTKHGQQLTQFLWQQVCECVCVRVSQTVARLVKSLRPQNFCQVFVERNINWQQTKSHNYTNTSEWESSVAQPWNEIRLWGSSVTFAVRVSVCGAERNDFVAMLVQQTLSMRQLAYCLSTATNTRPCSDCQQQPTHDPEVTVNSYQHTTLYCLSTATNTRPCSDCQQQPTHDTVMPVNSNQHTTL